MKKSKMLLCTALLSLSLTACSGGGSKDITIDPAKLSGELLTAVTSDTLSQTASELIPSIYFIEADDMESGIAYASSGATACEVAVIQSKDASKTDDVEQLFQKRVDNQSELYASYNQGEVDKLDKAIIKSAGAYTVLCVCDDTDRANDILKEYGF